MPVLDSQLCGARQHCYGPRRGSWRSIGAVDTARAQRILDAVRAIPEGFVRTYGDLEPLAPRYPGRVLATTTEDVPWHRVVRADGSMPKGARQRALLDAEGIAFR